MPQKSLQNIENKKSTWLEKKNTNKMKQIKTQEGHCQYYFAEQKQTWHHQ